MGRSFITPNYQRSAGALPLLWKAISLWMSRNPRYRKLFGPVSISQDYATASRHLMVEYLRDHCGSNELSPHVRPRHPFRPGSSRAILREIISAKIQSLEDCTTLVSSLEIDQKGLPILLKHYLRLNGKLLSFNVDPAFSSVVDGLILVDLTQTDPRLLAKYMGEARCRAYLAHHGVSPDHSSVAED
jgi:putative hemolysin